jgi:hypothetical protein
MNPYSIRSTPVQPSTTIPFGPLYGRTDFPVAPGYFNPLTPTPLSPPLGTYETTTQVIGTVVPSGTPLPSAPLAGWQLEMVSSCVRPAPQDEQGDPVAGYLVSADVTFISSDPARDEEYLNLTLREKWVPNLDAASATVRQLADLALTPHTVPAPMPETPAQTGATLSVPLGTIRVPSGGTSPYTLEQALSGGRS